MDQITGALVAVGMILAAGSCPWRSWRVDRRDLPTVLATIVSAISLSVLVAIVLTPALCATMMTPIEKGHNASMRASSAGSTRSSTAATCAPEYGARHGRPLEALLRGVPRDGGGDAGALHAHPHRVPPGRGPGASSSPRSRAGGRHAERTIEVIRRSSSTSEHEKDTVISLFTVQGFSFGGTGQNTGWPS